MKLTTKIQMRFSDLDRLGHVNNSIYDQYFDVARLDFMNATIGHLFDWNGRTMVLVHTEKDFLCPTLLGDNIFVETELLKIGDKSLHVSQKIIDDKGVIKVKSVCVFSTIDMRTGKSFPLPDEWRKGFEKINE